MACVFASSADFAMEQHFHYAIYSVDTVVAAIAKAYHHYKDLLIGQSIGCSCKDQLVRWKVDQRRHSTVVKDTIACVVDIATVTTAVIIVDIRVVVDLGILRRMDQGTALEHEAAVVTDHDAIFYFESIGSDHKALIDDHLMLSYCYY